MDGMGMEWKGVTSSKTVWSNHQFKALEVMICNQEKKGKQIQVFFLGGGGA